jgi:hypothetical protein
MKPSREQLMAAEWTFRLRIGRWAWIATAADGDVLATSDAYYPTLVDAILNAQQNGFACAEDRQPVLDDVTRQ